jgi:hypothetical protein
MCGRELALRNSTASRCNPHIQKPKRYYHDEVRAKIREARIKYRENPS